MEILQCIIIIPNTITKAIHQFLLSDIVENLVPQTPSDFTIMHMQSNHNFLKYLGKDDPLSSIIKHSYRVFQSKVYNFRHQIALKIKLVHYRTPQQCHI